ncbi:adenine-specific DNA methyltransferase [Corynebacterium striatum]|nr:adenine-specific DNA methyltransferase [Corynebacterium striatum]
MPTPSTNSSSPTEFHSFADSSPSAATQATEEFFGLVWPGKNSAAQLAHTPTALHKVAQNGESDSPNTIFEGDNLDALKVLGSEGFRADVIYIDPPYNTGKEFVYTDNYRRRRKMGSGSYGQWHAEWLSMMYPLRLPSFSGHPICTDLVSVREDVHCESTAQEVHAGVPA